MEHKKELTEQLSQELNITERQTTAVLDLLEENNTIPFIARYRKEATGGLDDAVLRAFEERLRYLQNLWERKDTVLEAIAEQGKLDAALAEKIKAAKTLVETEDLYRPYRQKKRTRASIARERGLLPLAEEMKKQIAGKNPEKEAAKYICADKDVPDADTALSGARDILAEQISDDAALRQWVRTKTEKEGTVLAKLKEKDEEKRKASVYAHYDGFEQPLRKLLGYQVLAMNRAEKEKALQLKLLVPETDILAYMDRRYVRGNSGFSQQVHLAAADAYNRLLMPSVETEVRANLTEKAETGAIHVFAENLRQLLMQPPMEGKTVLGWDPAFRTGCKLCVVDSTGKVLDTRVIYPTAPQNKVAESLQILKQMILKYDVDVISLGNGTASRESEEIIAKLLQEPELKNKKKELGYVIVSEAGASVYSASKRAAEEFPQYDVGQRSSVSIARRLQDPLSELVKIEPQAIGVGQYQHDMNQTALSEALSAVVEDCVNAVGVDLNTASAALLQYISGISRSVAAGIVAYREANGRFEDRRALLKVPKLGPKAFEQCAGFLRIRDGKNPLDMTGVHPESYEAAERLLTIKGMSKEMLRNGGVPGLSKSLGTKETQEKLAKELGIGVPTLLDMAKELEKPMRDPRQSLPKPVLRGDIRSMEDLVPGEILTGTVRNVIDFGVFVDIGVHQDGLVHISQLSDHFVKHPLDVVKVGDVVKVRVLDVDLAKKRIALSMKDIDAKG